MTKARVANVVQPQTAFLHGSPWGPLVQMILQTALNHKNIATLTTADLGEQDLLSGHCCPHLTVQPGLHRRWGSPSEGAAPA